MARARPRPYPVSTIKNPQRRPKKILIELTSDTDDRSGDGPQVSGIASYHEGTLEEAMDSIYAMANFTFTRSITIHFPEPKND